MGIIKTAQNNKKFLLLIQEEEVPEQFNSYMFLIMEVILLAKKLNRVFVLPYIYSQPRNSALCETGELDPKKIILGTRIDPLESYFNINALAEYIDVITLEDFAKISTGKLSPLLCFQNKYSDTNTVDAYGFKFGLDKKLIFDKKTKIFEITDELSRIEEPFVGISGCDRRNNFDKNCPNWHNRPDLDYWGVYKALVHSEHLMTAANDFIKANLNGRYIGVHWRRGDFQANFGLGHIRKDASHEKEMKKRINHYLIKLIQKVMKKQKINKVFLATNSENKQHLDFIKQKIPFIRYPSSGDWRDHQFESVIEQIICMKSDFFIASDSGENIRITKNVPKYGHMPLRIDLGYSCYERSSSFSRRIIDSRKLLSKEKGENFIFIKNGTGNDNIPLWLADVLLSIKYWTSKIILKTRPLRNRLRINKYLINKIYNR